MIGLVCDWLGAALVVAGLFVFVGAAAGLLRFPDFYTRMHAAGKGDTLCSLLIVLGVVVHTLGAADWDHFQWGHVLTPLKLLLICAFIMISSPVSTHALMDAGYDDGIKPVIGEGGDALGEDGVAPGAGDGTGGKGGA
ncbi:MAG: monovalent cation/H(+) antiporter subunit G [Akkermansiaceae bacterium]|nr:monovalent cation/H(+) antiporter subunit G [Akkermansiaceae bacterium]